jgi:sugar phosphate isomerase/epimerase
MKQSRRHWLAAAAATTLISSQSNKTKAASWLQADSAAKRPKICIFGKPIQDLNYEELANFLAKFPIDGLEATVRQGGQVDPKKLDEQLPRLHEALTKRNRGFLILASEINRVTTEAEKTLRLASKLGIQYFRMSYYRYQLDKPIVPQLEAFASQANELASLCKDMGVTGLYQNHAGANYLGAPVFDLVSILKGIPTSQIAIALDVRHTTIEGTTSWPILYSAAKPHLGALFVKDAIVDNGKVKDVDLGEGKAAGELFQKVKKDGLPPVISLHTEQIDHVNPALLPKRIEAIGRDIATLQTWLA